MYCQISLLLKISFLNAKTMMLSISICSDAQEPKCTLKCGSNGGITHLHNFCKINMFDELSLFVRRTCVCVCNNS